MNKKCENVKLNTMNILLALCAVGAEKILGNEIKFLGYKPTPSEALILSKVQLLIRIKI